MEKEDNLNPDMNSAGGSAGRVDPSEDIGGISRNESEGDEEQSDDAGDNMQ